MGCCTVEEWIAKFPLHWGVACRVIMLALGLVVRRHLNYVTKLPWRIFALADPRRPLSERMAMLDEWLDTMKQCCLPFGFARDLLASRPDNPAWPRNEIFSLLWQRILFFASWAVKMSTAAIEMIHAMNRRSANPQTVCSPSLSSHSVFQPRELELG